MIPLVSSYITEGRALFIQGLLDITKEVAKLEDKKLKLSSQIKRLQEATTKPDYETKVPQNVREQNQEKVRLLFNKNAEI